MSVCTGSVSDEEQPVIELREIKTDRNGEKESYSVQRTLDWGAQA